jgi:hypothetical protein
MTRNRSCKRGPTTNRLVSNPKAVWLRAVLIQPETLIYPWLREFKDKCSEALAASIAEGQQPKMTDKQKAQVKRWILGKQGCAEMASG